MESSESVAMVYKVVQSKRFLSVLPPSPFPNPHSLYPHPSRLVYTLRLSPRDHARHPAPAAANIQHLLAQRTMSLH